MTNSERTYYNTVYALLSQQNPLWLAKGGTFCYVDDGLRGAVGNVQIIQKIQPAPKTEAVFVQVF